MKAHAEFLEELKQYVKDTVAYWDDYLPDYGCGNYGHDVACDFLEKIEQFEAQLAGDNAGGSDKCAE